MSAFAITGLTVTYPGSASPAVNNLSLDLAAGSTLALVGESGSGKSTTAAVLAGLLGTRPDSSAETQADSFEVLGQPMLSATEGRWRSLRGTAIGYVPQDTGAGLNPVRSIGSQLAQVARKQGEKRAALRDRVSAALAEVGLDAQLHAHRYPHELSGGQRQRVLIALALIGRPRLVIADEPTSALDVTVQKTVLDLLAARVRETGASLLLITHDLGVAADRADAIAVMKNGELVEHGPTSQVLSSPETAYTRALLAASPGLHDAPIAPAVPADTPVVARLDGVSRTFASGGRAVTAVDDVSLELRLGQTLGIVGESGSGKSTTARLLLGLETADAGTINVLGQDMRARGAARLIAQRARFVHQDARAALDPRMTVAQSIAEPLKGFKIGTPAERAATVARLLEDVGLDPALGKRRPGELSGGQRQRVAIARALAVEPDIMVFDEPVSALDVSVQAQILKLLVRLQKERGLSYIFISHDLAVVQQISHQLVVMAAGRIIESGPTQAVFTAPQTDLTRSLLAAVPGHQPDTSAAAEPDQHEANQPAQQIGVPA